MRKEMWFEKLTVVQDSRFGTFASFFLFFLNIMKVIWFTIFVQIL